MQAGGHEFESRILHLILLMQNQMYLENCIQREISYENKRVELIQQDIRGNVNNIIKKQTITNACNAIHV